MELQRREVNYTDIYQNYYSEISLAGKDSKSAPPPPRSDVNYSSTDRRRDTLHNPHNYSASILSARGTSRQQQKPSAVQSFKRWASKAFQKTFKNSSTLNLSFKSKQTASVSSLPITTNTVQTHQHHRRTVSSRPLPSIPAIPQAAPAPIYQSAPRNLHKRRATNGGREMPIELKRVEQHKERLEKFKEIQDSMQTDVQGLFNLLGLCSSAGSDVRITEAVEIQLDEMSSKFENLKEIASSIIAQGSQNTPSLPASSAQSPPSAITSKSTDDLQGGSDDQTQVPSKVGSSRTSSTSSMDKLKELTSRLVNLTSRGSAVVA